MTFSERLTLEQVRSEVEIAGGCDLLPGDELHVPLMPREVPPTVDIEYTEYLTIRHLHETREAGRRVAVYVIAEKEVSS